VDGLALLAAAEAAGLAVRAAGDRLHIRGPRAAAAVAETLLAHKAAVLAALRAVAEVDGVDGDADLEDLRRRLASGALQGYGELRLADGTLVFDVAGYARENLDRLAWPPLAADAVRHLRLLRETLGAIDHVDAQA
jgi:hypothetical protein